MTEISELQKRITELEAELDRLCTLRPRDEHEGDDGCVI